MNHLKCQIEMNKVAIKFLLRKKHRYFPQNEQYVSVICKRYLTVYHNTDVENRFIGTETLVLQDIDFSNR